MTKEVIEKYIQFAIDNGYDELPIMEEGWYYIEDYILTITSPGEGIIEYEGDIYEIISSKEFIEAVARGIINNGLEKNFYDVFCDCNYTLDLCDEITKYQAKAIRDGKLEEFILELIK